MGTCLSLVSQAADAQSDGFVEKVVCRDDELQVGQLKEVQLSGGDQGQRSVCVVVKDEDGRVHALSGKCTHYGANLAKGSYASGVIRCPWHGACFSLATGDIEDFPGLDSLHKFQVSVEDGEVRVRARKRQLVEVKRVKPLSKRDRSNPETIVVVGGGGAAQECVETLRQDHRFLGRVILVTKEQSLPYDRPKLSKALSSTAEQLRLRNPAYYDEGDIEVLTEMAVTKVEADAKLVHLSTGDTLTFDKLILATGSSPRKLGLEGENLTNVFVIRTPEEANDVVNAAKGKDLVVIGTSFIGMEVACFFADKAASVTVVGQSSRPFEKSLGTEIGAFIQGLHEKKGVKFVMNAKVRQFIGDEQNRVKEVLFHDDSRLAADAVVLGVGVVPNTDFLRESGIDLTSSGFVRVNECLETNVKGIFAAGDIAHFPLKCADNQEVSIGHWQLALAHGRCAALNASGMKTVMRSVPFFWTVQFGKSIRYAGYAGKYDSIELRGNVDDGEFAAFFCSGDRVVAIATLMRDPLAAQFANLLSRGDTLLKEDIDADWEKRLLT